MMYVGAEYFVLFWVYFFLIFFLLPSIVIFLHFYAEKVRSENKEKQKKIKKYSLVLIIPFIVSIILYIILYIIEIDWLYASVFLDAVAYFSLFAMPFFGFLAGIGIVAFIFFSGKLSSMPFLRILLGIVLALFIAGSLFLFSPVSIFLLGPRVKFFELLETLEEMFETLF